MCIKNKNFWHKNLISGVQTLEIEMDVVTSICKAKKQIIYNHTNLALLNNIVWVWSRKTSTL